MDEFNKAKDLFIEGLDALENQDFLVAEEKFLGSLKLMPDRVSTLINLAASQIKLKKYDLAIESTHRVLSIDQSSSEGWLNLGLIQAKQLQHQEALSAFDKAIELNPGNAKAYLNKANTLVDLKRHEEALDYFDHAIKLEPGYAEAWYNQANTLVDLKRHEEALDYFDQAIKLDPNYADAYWNRALLKLLTQDLQGGWEDYEHRWSKSGAEHYRYPYIPELKTISNLKNTKILIWAEQGYGDTLQFSRYVGRLLESGAELTFAVQPALKKLIAYSMPGLRVIDHDEVKEAYDFQLPLWSLPRLLTIDFSSLSETKPYISPNPDKVNYWKSRLNFSKDKLNIGIACSGSLKVDLENGNKRPIPLSIFTELTQKCNLFLIQKDLRDDDKTFLKSHPEITYLGDFIQDFDDSAAMVECMDMIISIDTSLAHLAGAMGKKSFVLLPYLADWRWFEGAEESPWYPSMKLIRQSVAGAWAPVVHQVSRVLNI
jgi:tetratricopeptide (TPR) repeat protein